MSGYSDGVRVEHAVMHDLTANGYECTRAASSKGVADVIAIKAGQVLLVNVKRTTMPGPGERFDLVTTAGFLSGVGVPLVALKPLRQPLEYRRLTGPGPRDWRPWTPDALGSIVDEFRHGIHCENHPGLSWPDECDCGAGMPAPDPTLYDLAETIATALRLAATTARLPASREPLPFLTLGVVAAEAVLASFAVSP